MMMALVVVIMMIVMMTMLIVMMMIIIIIIIIIIIRPLALFVFVSATFRETPSPLCNETVSTTRSDPLQIVLVRACTRTRRLRGLYAKIRARLYHRMLALLQSLAKTNPTEWQPADTACINPTEQLVSARRQPRGDWRGGLAQSGARHLRHLQTCACPQHSRCPPSRLFRPCL